MLNRRRFLQAVSASLHATPLAAAEGQQLGKVHRLGVLTPGARPAPSPPVTANLLPMILQELGYVEGQNLVIEQRFAEGTHFLRGRGDLRPCPRPGAA